MRVVIESPLRGKTTEETRENYRYLLWCLRAVYLAGYRPIASHPVCPWFMDDADEKERADGIDWPWMWEPGVAHWFFTDVRQEFYRSGKQRVILTRGMGLAEERCVELGIPVRYMRLSEMHPKCWAAYQRGEWPPHTEGFGFDE